MTENDTDRCTCKHLGTTHRTVFSKEAAGFVHSGQCRGFKCHCPRFTAAPQQAAGDCCICDGTGKVALDGEPDCVCHCHQQPATGALEALPEKLLNYPHPVLKGVDRKSFLLGMQTAAYDIQAALAAPPATGGE